MAENMSAYLTMFSMEFLTRVVIFRYLQKYGVMSSFGGESPKATLRDVSEAWRVTGASSGKAGLSRG